MRSCTVLPAQRGVGARAGAQTGIGILERLLRSCVKLFETAVSSENLEAGSIVVNGSSISDEINNPRGSKYPIFEASGSKYHTIYGIWALKPQILGSWTLWECCGPYFGPGMCRSRNHVNGLRAKGLVMFPRGFPRVFFNAQRSLCSCMMFSA